MFGTKYYSSGRIRIKVRGLAITAVWTFNGALLYPNTCSRFMNLCLERIWCMQKYVEIVNFFGTVW
jgi:hypothetical protein